MNELGDYITHTLSRKLFFKKNECMYVLEREREREQGEEQWERDSVLSAEPTGGSSHDPESMT